MQQINLLPSGSSSTKKQLTANSAGLLLMASVVVMALVTGIQWWMLSGKENEKRVADNYQKELMLDIKTITAEINQYSNGSEFKRILVSKELELKNKQNVMDVLSGQGFGNTKGFAGHLTGLSRQHIEGLWLTNFNIHQGGEKLNIQGSTYAPEHVPKYLMKLGNEASFRGVEFKTFLMQRDHDTDRIDFDIRSNKKEAG